MGLLARLFSTRARRQALLRRINDELGERIEAWPYATLSRPAEEISFAQEIDGIAVSFSIEAYERNASGDLHVCVGADLAIFPFLPPSYVFWKRPDETIHY